MNATPFDTLSAARSLEASGIEKRQAEAIVLAIRSSGEAAATRTDLDTATALLRGDLDTATAALRGDLNTATTELRGELATMTAQLRGEIKAVAAELRGEISGAVNKMLLAQLAIAGFLFAALRIFG